MSLQTAALGWGIISRNNNLYINMNFIGDIYIGMDHSVLNSSIAKFSRIALRIKHDEHNFRRCIYANTAGEEVFSILIIGNVVYRLRYEGIANMIPQNLIYQVGKKRYITNNRVDGYMLAIKGSDEIYLKEDKVVPAIDIDSKSMGVVKKALTKRMAEDNSAAWMKVFNTQNDYAPDMYKKSKSEVAQLESEYKSLVRKESQLDSKRRSIVNIIDKRKILDEAQKQKQQAEAQYNEIKQAYSRILSRYSDSIKELVHIGKLRVESGIVRLNTSSDDTRKVRKVKSVPVYREVTRTYEPEMLLHEDYDQYLERRKAESSSYTEKVFDGYRDEPYYEEVVDEQYKKAKSIYKELEEPGNKLHQANKSLEEAQSRLTKAEKEVQAYMQTTEYKNGLNMLDNIDAELKTVRSQMEKLKVQLYGR